MVYNNNERSQILYYVYLKDVIAYKPNDIKSRAIMSSSHTPRFELGQLVYSLLYTENKQFLHLGKI